MIENNKKYLFIILLSTTIIFFAGISLVSSIIFFTRNKDSIQEEINFIRDEVKGVDNQKNDYHVTKVVDGDTIKVDYDGITETLRLIGIDTPETVDPRKSVQCFGLEASQQTKMLLEGKYVRLEFDLSQGERDKYGRLLAYVYRADDNLFVNKYLIEHGYAFEYTYNSPYKYQRDFQSAENTAQDEKRGLWNECK